MISLNAYAKVNLSLDIVGRRDDGYHLLRTIMQSISLADTVTVELTSGEIAVTSDIAAIPSGKANICYGAVQAFFEEIKRPDLGACVSIVKRIPHGAGMGGGSADCAAVLHALNELCGKPLELNQLIVLGAKLGADVPFCLVGGTCLCEGVGEIVSPLAPLPKCHIVIAKSIACISTSVAFAEYDKIEKPQRFDNDGQVAALNSGNLKGVAAHMHNIFEVLKQCEQADMIKAKMLELGALGAILTGSGSAVCGIFESEANAIHCKNELAKTCNFTAIATPVNSQITL